MSGAADHSVIERETTFYKTLRVIVSSWFEIVHHCECAGIENFPIEGPCILASNHTSFYDPPLLGYPLPRPLFYFARRTLLEHKWLAWFIMRLNTIPVDRDAADFGALKKVFKELKSGHCVLMFPEGTRTRTGITGAPRDGVGMVACKAGVPVVPAWIEGAFQAWGPHRKLPRPGAPIQIYYGQPLSPEDFDPGSTVAKDQRYKEASRRILEAIKALNPGTTLH